MNFIPLAAAQPQGGGIQMIVMLVGLFAIVYFFMIRPQNKKQKEKFFLFFYLNIKEYIFLYL